MMTESNDADLQAEESKEKTGHKGFTEMFQEMGFDMEGVDPDADLPEVFKKINVQKIVVCDDARTFDLNNYDKMRDEGRVICEIPLNCSNE